MKEKLRELYRNGQVGTTPCISANGLLKAITNGWITLDDAIEIIGGKGTLPIVRATKLKEISITCSETIVNGVDPIFDDETVYFNLSVEDQVDITNLFHVVELGGTEFLYQADGGVCRIYITSEIATTYITAQTLITTQTTCRNELKAYIRSLDSAEAVTSIVHGMTLSNPYSTEINEELAVANEQMRAIIAHLSSATNT